MTPIKFNMLMPVFMERVPIYMLMAFVIVMHFIEMMSILYLNGIVVLEMYTIMPDKF